MLRKFIWVGIITALAPFTMAGACGGYQGYLGRSTEGTDAKVITELSVSSTIEGESGLWLSYVNYDNTDGVPNMKTVSSYRDATAPFGVFTSDGLGLQHFNDHVGTKVTTAYDTTDNGTIIFGEDYAVNDGFCQTGGDPDSSDGFSAYCTKGLWSVLVFSNVDQETKQSSPGSKFSNANPPTDYIVSPFEWAKLIASSTPIAGGVSTSVSALSVGGDTHAMASPITAGVYGFGRAIAFDASQPGVNEAAAFLADKLSNLPDGQVSVTLQLNGGAASASIRLAGGAAAAEALRSRAGS